MSETKYQATPGARLVNGQSGSGDAVDSGGSRFTNESYRWFVAVTPGDVELPHGSCDGLNLSAAATVVVVGTENDPTDQVTLILPAGQSKIAARRIVSTSAGSIVACYYRHPGT